MRLDIFLKLSRLIARRSLAQEFCEAALVSVNGSPAKSSREVKLNDEIEIRRGSGRTKVRVVRVPLKKQVARSDASDLYEIIEQVVEEPGLLP